MSALKLKVVKVEGNTLTVELPEGIDLKEGAVSVHVDMPESSTSSDEMPPARTELGKALLRAREAYLKGGGKPLSREELDHEHDVMRGRA